MATLRLEHALLPGGWADAVRVEIDDGMIVAVIADAPRSGAEFLAGIAVPGVPNGHSHAFQRGMAGLTETRGPGADSFWIWREVMYRFLAVVDPPSVEAISAYAYMGFGNWRPRSVLRIHPSFGMSAHTSFPLHPRLRGERVSVRGG